MVKTDSFKGRHPSEDVYDNPLAQNVLMEEHCQGGPEITFQVLAQLLCVANTCKDGGPCCSVSPGTNSVVQNATAVHLIQRSVSQHFPKPPADVNQNLQQHLLNVQKTVLKELKRLGPRLESSGLAGCLIECYHHHTFDHLSGLLQNTSSSQNCLVLMKWVLQTYLRYLSVNQSASLPTVHCLLNAFTRRSQHDYTVLCLSKRIVPNFEKYFIHWITSSFTIRISR